MIGVTAQLSVTTVCRQLVLMERKTAVRYESKADGKIGTIYQIPSNVLTYGRQVTGAVLATKNSNILQEP